MQTVEFNIKYSFEVATRQQLYILSMHYHMMLHIDSHLHILHQISVQN